MSFWEKLLGGLPIVGGLFAADAAGDAAKSSERVAMEQLGLSKEWMDKQWEYQEPLLQEYVRRSQATNPIYRSLASMLGGDLGLDMDAYLGDLYGDKQGGTVQPPVNPPPPAQPPAGGQSTHQQNLLAGKRVARVVKQGGRRVAIYTDGTTAPIDQPAATQPQTRAVADDSKYLRVDERPAGETGDPVSNVPSADPSLVGGQTQRPSWMDVPTGEFKLPDVPAFDPSTLPEAHRVSDSLVSALSDVPDWRNPMTREQEAAFTSISDMGLQEKKNSINSALGMNLARRGLSAPGVTSGVALSGDVSAQNWFDRESSAERSRLALEKMARGDALRSENVGNQTLLDSLRRQESDDVMKRYLTGEELAAARRGELSNKLLTEEGVGRDRRSEAARNFYNLLSTLSGGAADLSGYSDLSNYADQAMKSSGIYSGMSNQYANDQASMINNLFGIFGKIYGDKSSKASLL
jgi:hypothetical protein